MPGSFAYEPTRRQRWLVKTTLILCGVLRVPRSKVSRQELLDKIPLPQYKVLIPSAEGRFHEASCQWDGMRRPRAGFADRPPGGAGAPPGVTTDPCEELADDPGQSPGRKARPGAGDAKLSRLARHRDGAPQGAACPQGTRLSGSVAPSGAPSPSLRRGTSKRGRTRRRPNNTGDDACDSINLKDCRIANENAPQPTLPWRGRVASIERSEDASVAATSSPCRGIAPATWRAGRRDRPPGRGCRPR
jgi:hypothetical protein